MKNQMTMSSIAILLLAMCLIPLGDVGGKLLTQQGVSPTFVAWSRFFIGFALLLPISRLKFAEFSSLFNWRILIRGACITGSIWCILTALSTEPVVNVYAAVFIAPVISYFLAKLILKEHITLARTVLLLIGFCGVLVVIRPSLHMSSGMVYALIASCFYTGYLVCNKWLVTHYRPRFMLISQLFFGSIVLAPFGLSAIPNSIDINISLLILLSAFGSAAGNLLMVESNRRLPANIVSPFIYTQLLFATLYGIVVFNDLPDTWSQLGLMVIISSGFSSWFLAGREHKQT